MIARITAVLLLALGPRILAAEAAPSREYQIKAAFLLNFTQFVAWPAGAFASDDAPLVIGVLGDDPFGPALEETVRGERVRTHPIVVKRSRRAADLADCQLVFVCRSERSRTAEILRILGGRPALTVSETDDFAKRGGIINFYLEGRKVRFEINAEAAQREGLKISSQLLSLGRIVRPAGEGEVR